MNSDERNATRDALRHAAEQLLEGHVPGPLTGVRLAELAGVKRHRLTHDNPDISAEFQHRAKQINRTKPEVERLRTNLDKERAARRRVTEERDRLRERLDAYATALLVATEERDRLLRSLSARDNVTALPRPR
ncbi:hypothetical protein [Microbacterium sp. NPDC091662]|uniref:hypothetical protein n=1 Tax=Microbacterium sp. NPDC091662 TaxID=3364211 RepID=UPI00380F365A